MRRVVGYEGSPAEASGVSWGTAAIQQTDEVWNSATGVVTSVEEFEALVQSGLASRVPPGMNVEGHVEVLGLVVARYSKSDPYAKALKSLFRREFTQDKCENEYSAFGLFSSLSKFKKAARFVVSDLVSLLLDDAWDDTEASRHIIKIGLTLDRGHPALNAIWTYKNRTTPMIERLARTHLVGQEAQEHFERILEGLAATKDDVIELRFQGGTADIGALEVGVSASLLNGFDILYGAEASHITKLNDYLRNIPPPDLQERQAASVDWRFRTSGGSMRDRLGRSMVLKAIERRLRSGAEGVDELELRAAYGRLARPAAGVALTVRHGQASFVAPAVTARGLRWWKQLSQADAQQPHRGRPVPYLRLTKSKHNIEYRTWFREEFFAGVSWVQVPDQGGTQEDAEVSFSVWIQGIPLGLMMFKVSHNASRAASHGHPPTWLHWNPQLLHILRHGYHAYHYVQLLRYGDSALVLSIDSAPPA